MRILLINDYAAPLGGAELGLVNLRTVLRERGHQVRLFGSTAGLAGRAGLADDSCLGTMSRWRTLLQTGNPWAYVALRRVLRQFRPDVIHVRMFLTQLSPLILRLLHNVPTLYDVVWYRPVCPTGTKTLPDGRPCQTPYGTRRYRQGCVPVRDWPLLMLQMNWWRRRRGVFRLFLAKSQAVKAQLLTHGIEPVELLWDGVPLQPARPPLTDPPTVFFAGRLVREKGVDVLLRAFGAVSAELPTARLVIAGEGAERPAVERLIDELQLRAAVRLTGQLSPAELEREAGTAWVQAVPSTWVEPFGLVAAEALMRGTAAVVTNSGGLAEMVRPGETGSHVAAGDVAGWTAALRTLLRDRELAERMGQAGRARALTEFSKETYVNRIVKIYDGLRQPPRNQP